MGKQKVTTLTTELKYKYYERSVQNTDAEVHNLNKIFKEVCKRTPYVLREDFCGTGMLCCDWANQSKKHESFGLDLDPEPIAYGKEKHLTKLSSEAQKRVEYIEGNVLEKQKRKSDLTVAFNFSYFIFKKRAQLKEYFSAVRAGLKSDGLFLLDIFGGPECVMPLEEETEYGKFSYFWDCKEFNPITNECLYAIHFKPKGGKKFKDAFVYDWRMWSIPEICEILEEAGFSNVITYWEGEDDDGTGDGEFFQTVDAENCESWVTYIAAQP